ncbi:5-hydroxytryptamine receptor like protein [Argiope bruennichi]|uniref:5-hydroxytryptamine receptor like protein n=1 Tax=Argiope bruennichi TaxID=94029 RepID=A0A8T0E835_ARGBR|nr:5-hydroxytryptamine receptor like protein [Argiope bruennichi]
MMRNTTAELLLNSGGFHTNFTVEEAEITGPTELFWFAAMCLALGILISATVIGNVFVMVAIVKDRNLNNLSNYLVFSLALADLLVALLVMPIGAVYEVKQQWTMGAALCDLWTSCDVLCCTASILHLLAIAVDRYWAVTNVDYARNRCKKRIYLAIFLVWTISFTVSIAPIFGWKDPDFNTRIEVEKRCLVSQDLGYQIFATCSSFYVPLVMILILYSRIFQEARKRIRRRPGAASQAMLLVQRPPPVFTDSKRSSSSPSGGSSFDPPSSVVDTTLSCNVQDNSMATAQTVNGVQPVKQPLNAQTSSSGTGAMGRLLHIGKREKKPENNLAKREKKAAKTLAIITGVFVVCWLPFFIMALLLPLCNECEPDFPIFSIFLWLGYANSTLNPIIYTIFSPDFRSAFKKLLCPMHGTQRPNL